MADANKPDSSLDSSSTPSPDWCAKQWEVLCDELGVSDPEEVVPRVRTLKRQMDRLDAGDRDPSEGLVTISEVEQVFREMNDKMQTLRERNAALAERLEGEDEEVQAVFQEMYQKSEQLLEALDAATMDEARSRIQHLNSRLEELYREKEQLVQAGFSGTEEILDEMEQLRSERDALRRERDELRAERNRLKQERPTARTSSTPSGPDTSVLEAAVLIREHIGVSAPDEAEALLRVVEKLHSRVREYAEAHDVQAGLEAPSDVLSMLRSMAEQLRALPNPKEEDGSLPPPVVDALGVSSGREARKLAAAVRRLGGQLAAHVDGIERDELPLGTDTDVLTLLRHLDEQLRTVPDSTSGDSGLPAEAGEVLGVQTVEDARELESLIGNMSDRLEQLSREHEKLEEAGLTVDAALTMIESMEAQLEDLYRDRKEEIEANKQLDAIEEVLGIRSRDEAEELSALARNMEAQLDDLYREKEKLEALGLSSIDDAVDMIESMEAQLEELYGDKEDVQDALRTETIDGQSTFQQLESLYAEQEKLQRALGVSSADEVVEMVEGLATQLDEFYEQRDRGQTAPDREAISAQEEEVAASPSTEDARSSSSTLMVSSMERQLEALYREKETLLHHGYGNAREVVSHLQTQQEQINALQRENHTYEQRFDRLESEIGTASVSQLVEVVQSLEAEADASIQEMMENAADSSTEHHGPDIDATSPFVSPSVLDDLEEMERDELDDLDVAVIQLGDEGEVEELNEAALQLPGLRSVEDREAIIGANFFLDLAPSTNNNLFYGRFKEGQQQGAMDARFPYTFTSPEEGPKSFAVHLHRKPDRDVNWLLFRPT